MKVLSLLAAAALLTKAVLASPSIAFEDDVDEIMPGVRSFRSARLTRADSDTAIIFPGSPGFANTRPVSRPAAPAAPLPAPGGPDFTPALPEDLDMLGHQDISRLNTISKISDYMLLFNLTPPEEPVADFSNLSARFGGVVEKPEEAVMANCMPEVQTVALELPVESGTHFFPTCVRLERCGGCCYGPLLTCRATATKNIMLKVLKTVTGSSGTSRTGRNTRRRRQSSSSFHEVEVVQHTACACGCRVQESDCNAAVHNYMEGECACVCKNKDEKRKCEQQNSTKYWDNKTCNCYCHKHQECSSGEIFSHASCSCEMATSRSAFSFPANRNEGPTNSISGLGLTRPQPVRPLRHRPVRVPLT